MRWVKRAGLASLLLIGTAGYGLGAAPSAPGKEPDKASPSLDAVIGKKLISIDGSVIVLSTANEGLLRQITSPNGAVQKTSFTFISERLGTVADSADKGKVVAVFRATEAALDIQFADGTSELVLANSLGGISIESTSAAKETFCMAWYPEGHAFTMDERKAALAQYAVRLGLGDSAQKGAAGSPCTATPARVIEAKADVPKADATKTDAPKSDAAKADPAPTPAAITPAPAGPRVRRGAALRPVAPRQAMMGDMKQVEVRNSEIHLVPEDVAPAPAPDVAAKQVVASLETPAAPKADGDAKSAATATAAKPAEAKEAPAPAAKAAEAQAPAPKVAEAPADAPKEVAAAKPADTKATDTAAAPKLDAKPAPAAKAADAKAPEAAAAAPKTDSDAKSTATTATAAKPAETKVAEAKAPEAKPQVVAALPPGLRPFEGLPAKAAPAAPQASAAKPAETKAADKGADAKASDAKPQVVAALEKPSLAPPAAPAAELKGASSCLSIESDGSHWGFRNHCGYTVQFAYCQMNQGGQPASCRDGTVPGSVAPNGFGALVADQSLKETDVEHDFRWVACQGGAGEVIPRLEQTDPPVGRCVR